MAKRKLNKKLALFLLSVVGCVVVLGVVLFLNRYQDPVPFLERAKELSAKAVQAMRDAESEVASIADHQERFEALKKLTEEKIDPERIKAREQFNLAYKFSLRARRPDVRAQVAEAYSQHHHQFHMPQAAQAIWEDMIGRDPQDAQSMVHLLRLYKFNVEIFERMGYPLPAAMSAPALQAWTNYLERAELLRRIKADDPFGRICHAHALVGLIEVSTDLQRAERLAQADELIQQILAADAHSLEGFRLLGRYRLLLAEDSQDPEQRGELVDQARQAYRQAIASHPEDALAWEYYGKEWCYRWVREMSQSIRSVSEQRQDVLVAEGSTAGLDQVVEQQQAAMEALFVELQEEFQQAQQALPGAGVVYEIHAALLERRLSLTGKLNDAESFDGILDLLRQAIDQEDARTLWFIRLATMVRTRAHFLEDDQAELEKAFELLREAQFRRSATELESRQNRLMVLQQLIEVVSILAATETDSQRKSYYLAVCDDTLAQINDAFGSDSHLALFAQGLNAWARDDYDQAIRYLFQARELSESTGQLDRTVSLHLFKLLRSRGQHVEAHTFGIEAMASLARSPRLFFEVLETISRINDQTFSAELYRLTHTFESIYGLENQYSDDALRYRIQSAARLIRFLTGDARENVLQTARSAFDLLKDKDQIAVKIWMALLEDDATDQYEALELLSTQAPENLELTAAAYQLGMGLSRDDASYLERLGKLVDRALQAKPHEQTFKRMQGILASENPLELTFADEQRIVEGVIEAISDPVERLMTHGDERRRLAALATRMGDVDASRTQLQEAVSSYRQAIEQQADNWDAISRLFQAHLNLDDVAAARSLLDEYKQKSTRTNILRMESDLALHEQNWSLLAQKLQELIELAPASSTVHLALAQAYSELQRNEDAMQAVSRARQLNPTNNEALRLFVSLRHNQLQTSGNSISPGEIQEMMQYFQQLLNAANPNQGIMALSLVYYPRYMRMRSDLLRSSGDVDPAEHDAEIGGFFDQSVLICRRLLDADEQNVRAWIQLAALYEEYSNLVLQDERRQELAGQIDAVLDEAMAANPDSQELASAYSQFLLSKGKEQSGLEVLQQRVEQTSGARKIEARVSLATYYLRQGNYPACRLEIDAVLQEQPDHRQARLILLDVAVLEQQWQVGLDLVQDIRSLEDSAELSARQADLLIALGQIDRAREFLGSVVARYPDSVDVQLGLAKCELAQLNYDRALEAIEALIDEHPDDSRLYLLQARTLYYQQQFAQAHAALETLRARKSHQLPEAGMLTAQIYWADSRYDEAISGLQEVLLGNPRLKRVRDLLLSYLEQRGRWEQLMQMYGQVLEENPNDPAIYLRAAGVMSQYGGQLAQQDLIARSQELYQQSRELIEKTLELCLATGRTDVYDSAYDQLLLLLLRMGQLDEVIRLTERGIAENPAKESFYIRQIQALLRKEQPESALSVFEQCIELAKDRPLTEKNLVSQLPRIFGLEMADAWVSDKLASRPDWVPLYYAKAEIHMARQESEQQLSAYEKALTYAKDAGVVADLKSKLATFYDYYGHDEQAIATYRELLGMEISESGRVGLLNNLAYLLMSKPEFQEEAAELAQEAYELSRGDPVIMDTYAVVLIKQGLFGEAIRILRLAVQKLQRQDLPVHAEFYIHLAQAYHGEGRIASAQEAMVWAREALVRRSVSGSFEDAQAEFKAIEELVDSE